MKRIAFVISLAVIFAVSCGQESEKKNNDILADSTKSTDTLIKTENRAIEMKTINEPEFDIITTHGTMRVRLYEKTPKHKDNFVKLVSEKYYDGIRFHRVIEGFMIQTGDPYSRDTAQINKWGTGGPDYTIPAEFVGEYRHKKGALAAARKGDLANPKKASSGSQFYIVHDEEGCSHLDGQYTIFGEVINGLDVIDKIATTATDPYSRPYEDIIITTIKPVIKTVAAPLPAQNDSTKVE